MNNPSIEQHRAARQARLSGIKEIEDLKDFGRGQRCFVVATGPSLNLLRLDLLADDFVFGVNRAYLALQRGLPHIDLLVIGDPNAYRQYHEEIESAPVSRLMLRSNVHALVENEGHDPARSLSYPYHASPCMDEGHFARDLTQGTYRGFAVPLEAVQIAYYMGFSEVCLLGCDLDYSGTATHFYKGGAHEEASRTVMPIDRVRQSMRVARAVYEADNRRLLNASAGGTLEELERVAYASLFQAA